MPELPHLGPLLGGFTMTEEPRAYLHGFSFSGMAGEITATTAEEVMPALMRLERQVATGLHAAGFISYEAAGAINGDLTTLPPADFPLLWFGLFERRSTEPFPSVPEPFALSDWKLSWSEQRYVDAVASVRDFIAAGDCYQVNLTMRQLFSFSGSPRSFFNELLRCQPTPYNCYLEAGRHRILSASPELFFSLEDGILRTRPMKGTAVRGRWFQEDEAQKERLKTTPKELAENLMIVDLLRNDMGIISETGSVQVSSLFDIESHPTVHQMTSTIESRLNKEIGALGLMKALFPCGSVTGAPKRRSMEIIAELEDEPRGLYTGCIGYFSPEGEAKFCVAIRTAVLDLETGRGEIGIGSGITFDSVAADEHAECLSKGGFARQKAEEFHLIESLLLEGGVFFLLERHLARVARSASYFAFPLDLAAVRRELERISVTATGKQKVRLLLFKDGGVSCTAAPIADATPEAAAGFATSRADSSDRFLYHKTSRRELYRKELALRPDLAEVIFMNERGEVTEGAISNIVILLDSKLLTPPVQSGLLPGVFREELLETGVISEAVLTRKDLERAQEIYAINSVRKWRKVQLAV
jgi:para-aminobenzoate synthetase / 4-amino-4-deoxychorismate lyase